MIRDFVKGKRYLLGLTLLIGLLLALGACRPPAPEPAPAPAPSPTATAQPAPTPAITSTPAPTASTPQASSARPTDTRLGDKAMEFDRHLSVTLGKRTSGTDLEKRAADYIKGVLEGLGYNATLQSFTVTQYSAKETFLTLDKPQRQDVQANPLTQSTTGKVSAPLVLAGLGKESDFPPEGVQGKAVLLQRGEIFFEVKVSNATKAGASAVIVYNNAVGGFFGALQNRSSIPAVSISQEDGEKLKALLNQGEVSVTVQVKMEESPSQNVVAVKGGGEKVIIIGGHYDTTEESPGANDNGSGTAAMLTVAQELAKESLGVTLRFIAFGSEELGLLGSRDYVEKLTEDEKKRIIAMINLDGLGAGVNLEAGGEGKLLTKALTLADSMELRVVRSRERGQGAGSDHFHFQRVGIPALFIFGGDFSKFHTPDDRIEFVDKELLDHAARLTIALVKDIAKEATR